MSNYLAPATVTAALKIALENALTTDALGFNHSVDIGRPDDIDDNGNQAGVNIYLYQVTPNTAWRNADLPTRNGRGALVQRPRVALDLHYLLTFFGDESALQDQRLLGSVIATLHEQPLLTQAMIEAAMADTDFSTFLNNSDLANEIEQVKFSPISFNLEELSKLWSVFFQTAYRLSVAYVASLVFIERQPEPVSALPVQIRAVTALPSIEAEQALTPADLADLQLWLRSDYDVTYDSNGVSAWGDQSNNAHHALQSTADRRPAFVAHGLGQYPVLRFDGDDDRLPIQTLNYNSPLNEVTVCALIRVALGSDQVIISFDDNRYWELALSSDGLVEWRTRGTTGPSRTLSAPAPLLEGRWTFICARFDAGATNDKQLFLDGVLAAEEDAHGGNALGSGGARFGFVGVGSVAGSFDGSVAAGTFFGSDLAEIAIYNRALTETERDQLEIYFAQRYG